MTENVKRMAKKHKLLTVASYFLALEVMLFAVSLFWSWFF